MSWTALVPIKAAVCRKSRLIPHLTPFERAALTHTMLDHVIGRLHDCASVGRVMILSPSPVGTGHWVPDHGRGLNEELSEARSGPATGPLVVLLADLPLLTIDDVDALLASADRCGRSIAPDRHLTGTNAIALADGDPIAWHFGAASFARHRVVLGPGHGVVERPGLLLDCDTPADLILAEARGFDWRSGRTGRDRPPSILEERA